MYSPGLHSKAEFIRTLIALMWLGAVMVSHQHLDASVLTISIF